MPSIFIEPDCGNAPKKLFPKSFYEALAHGYIDLIASSIADDVIWDFPGSVSISGKGNYLAKVQSEIFWGLEELRIDTVVTHGAYASVSGSLTRPDGRVLQLPHIQFND